MIRRSTRRSIVAATAAACAALVTVGACASGGTTTGPAPPQTARTTAGADASAASPARVGCRTALRVDGQHRRFRGAIRRPPVAFLALRGLGTVEPSRFESRDGRDFVRKAPLIVDAGQAAVVSIPPKDRAHVALGYDRGSGAPRSVRDADPEVEALACPGTSDSAWPGVIVVDGPRCVVLTITSPGRSSSQELRVPFGRGTCSR